MAGVECLGVSQSPLDPEIAGGSPDECNEDLVVAMATTCVQDVDDGFDRFDGDVLDRDLKERPAELVTNCFTWKWCEKFDISIMNFVFLKIIELE